MSQILHIFRKDTRRLWLEIGASLVALAVFAAFSPDQWNFSPAALHRRSSFELLMLLVPATWWLLIGRLIQAESLVGDRQFWVTRPYEWKQLLAAKVLFVLVWIYVPFLLMQAAIVKEAGLSPLTNAAGWLHCMVLVSGCILLPLIVIAAVTENFARMTLTLFGGVVVLVAASYVTFAPHHGYESTTPYDHHIWIIGVLIAGAVIAIPLQYAWRRVWLARAVLLGVIGLATVLGMTMGVLREGQISRLYAVSGSAPLQLTLDPERTTVHNGSSERPGMFYLSVPVDFSGVAAGTAVQIDDVKVRLDDASGGWHWTAPWWASQTMRILPGFHHGHVEIMLSREQVKRMIAGSTTMQLTLGTTELEAGNDTTAVIEPPGDFPVAGLGICSTRQLYRFGNSLICRSAMGQPRLTRISATWHPKACSDEQRMPDAQLTATAWSGMPYNKTFDAYEHSLAYGVFPVRTVPVNLNPDWHDGNDLYLTIGFGLCPGTVVHFTPYAVSGRTQVSISIPSSYFQDPGLRKILDGESGEQ